VLSTQPDLSVLIVNYNGGQMLLDCVDSLYRDPLSQISQVLIVDNASSDDSVGRAAAAHPVEVLLRDQNDGFGAANNAGLARCSGRYTLIMNPDTWLADGCIERLVAFMDEHPRSGLAGPRLIGPDGRIQRSIRNYPTVLGEVFQAAFLHRLFPSLATRFANVIQADKEYENPRRVDWVSGAVMLGRTQALRSVGGFDEAFFLYAEEIDLCRQLTDGGWEVWYCPRTTVAHVGGAYAVDPMLALESQKSMLMYFRKHHGRAKMLGFALVIVLKLMLRVCVFSVASLLPGGRSWRGRLRATATCLWHYPRLVGRFALASGPLPVAAEHPRQTMTGSAAVCRSEAGVPLASGSGRRT
jgi:GT2 family glycosyltransferase